MDDSELLDRYGRDGDQEAFAELVRRHSEWIYPSARRQLGDAHLAEDVTQAVFLLLARKAAGISARANLGGWLFGTLRYCVKEAGRQRFREQKRVKEAAQMKQDSAAEANWELIAPLLDEAIGRLRKSDREAVLLRFYQRKPLAEVGRLLGVSEDAARMRVDRAVEKLRGMLQKQGVTGTSAGLSAVLVGNVVEEVPARVVERVMSAIGGGGGSVVAGGIAKGAGKMMSWAKLKVAMLGVGIGVSLALAGAAVYAQNRGEAPGQASAQQVAAKQVRANAMVSVTLRGDAVSDARDALAARIERLQNIDVEFSTDTDITPLPSFQRLFKNGRAKVAGGQLVLPTGKQVSEQRFSFLSGRALFQERMSDDTIEQIRKQTGAVFPQFELRTFTPERFEILSLDPGATQHLGTIDRRADLPPSIINAALALRPYSSQQWVDSQSVQRLQFRIDAQGRVLAEMPGEYKQTHTWFLDPAKEFAPVAYTISNEGGRLVNEYECSDFIPVRGLLFPQTIRGWDYGYEDDGSRHAVATVSLHVERVALDDVANTPERYRVVWPKGTQLWDTRAGRQFIVQGEDHRITDEMILGDRRPPGHTLIPASKPSGSNGD